ncbi:hypothetical protein GGI20_003071 [Coemansia sp. BCRC 34301]|nr:hypothetical protein GGI20_003071 [Coemansia sp. BCRC 34301]
MNTSASVPTDTMYKLTLRGQYALSKEGQKAPAIVQSPIDTAWGGGGGIGRGIPAGIDTNDELAGRSSNGGAMNMSGIWLSVFYSEEKQWRKISFPPGVTVGQARDICMLRFNVWHRVMERDMLSAKSQEDCGGTTASSIISGSTGSSGNMRELYGLYWPAGGQWLESLRLVAKYGLKSGDILELQEVGAFIPTPTEVTKNILVVEHNRQQQQQQQQLRPAVAERLTSSGMAESAIHYLHSKNLSVSWKLCWLELADHQLVCHKKQGAKGSQALARINLARGFKLVDQSGNVAGKGAPYSDALGRFSSDSASVHSAGGTSSMASILGLAAYGRAQLGGDGSALIIKCEGQVHVFCTLSAVDYDSWRRALQAEKGHHRSDASTTASSFEQQQVQLQNNRWTTPSSMAASCPPAVGPFEAPESSSSSSPQSSLGDRLVPGDPPTGPPPIRLAPSAPPEPVRLAPSAPPEPSVRRSRSFVSSISRIDWPIPPTTLPSAASNLHHHARHQQQRAEMPSISRAASRTATDGLPSPGSPAPPMPSSQQRDHLHLHRSLMLLPTRFPWFRRSNTPSSSAASSPATPPKHGL